MPLCRLVYRSQTSWDNLSNEMLRELARASEKRNQERGISGLLVLSGETFLQVLEGDSKEVNELYAKIIQDKRHYEVTLISFEQITSRCFEDWSMRVADLNELPVSSRDLLRSKYPEEEGYIEIPDDSPRALALLFDARALCLSETD